MGDRGPLAKDERSRKRDNVPRDQLKNDGVLRGMDLPIDLLGDGLAWHPATLRWWEAFRRSPQAQRVETQVQWETLAGAMVLYDEYLTMGARGRTMRMTEFRSFFTSYYITPGDLRRSGLEIVEPESDDDTKPGDGPKSATVTRLDDRRSRIMNPVPDEPEKKPARRPAKKSAAAKKAPARKRPATTR